MVYKLSVVNAYDKIYCVSIEWKKWETSSILKTCNVKKHFYLPVWITCDVKDFSRCTTTQEVQESF